MFENIKNRKPDISEKEYYKCFAVLVPLVEREDGCSVLFQVRAGDLRSQPNEVCFPGGAIEQGESPYEATIREACEELCIQPPQIEMICPLDFLITPFHTIIYPYMAFLKNYEDTFSKDEVQDIFYLPLDYLLHYKPVQYYNQIKIIPDENFPFDLIPSGKDYKWGVGRYPVYFHFYRDKMIWGLTSKILDNMIQIIKLS